MELAKNEDPDLIICDIIMPEMDGIELTKMLKTEFHTSHIPIILLTAKSLDEHSFMGLKLVLTIILQNHSIWFIWRSV